MRGRDREKERNSTGFWIFENPFIDHVFLTLPNLQALLSGLAFMKFRQGSASAFAPSFEPSDQPTPYPGTTATSVGNDSYQQPPFDPTTTKSGDPGLSAPPSQAQYQAPSY